MKQDRRVYCHIQYHSHSGPEATILGSYIHIVLHFQIKNSQGISKDMYQQLILDYTSGGFLWCNHTHKLWGRQRTLWLIHTTPGSVPHRSFRSKKWILKCDELNMIHLIQNPVASLRQLGGLVYIPSFPNPTCR